MTTEIKVQKGELIDKALRRLKNKVDASGLMDELRRRKRHMNKGQLKKYKQKQLDKSWKTLKISR